MVSNQSHSQLDLSDGIQCDNLDAWSNAHKERFKSLPLLVISPFGYLRLMLQRV